MLAIGILLVAVFSYMQETPTRESMLARYVRHVVGTAGGLGEGITHVINTVTQPGGASSDPIIQEGLQIRDEWNAFAIEARLPAECRGEGVEDMPSHCLPELLTFFDDVAAHVEQVGRFASKRGDAVKREMMARGM